MTTTNAQHTPGPWVSDGKVVGWLSGSAPAVRVSAETSPGTWDPVCMVPPHLSGTYQTAGSRNPIADARLIAAAPTLLVILDRALGEIGDMLDGADGAPSRICKGYQERLRHIEREARAAIRKATGGAA